MSFLDELIVAATWDGLKGLLSSLTNNIKITEPRPQETLKDPQVDGDTVSYRVRGTLKRLPRNHRIWLLTQDELSGDTWPHGLVAVQFNAQSGEWSGRVTDITTRTTKIIAVVAPPTSSAFFTYYQDVGTKTKWRPLSGVPVECRNRTEVQAVVP